MCVLTIVARTVCNQEFCSVGRMHIFVRCAVKIAVARKVQNMRGVSNRRLDIVRNHYDCYAVLVELLNQIIQILRSQRVKTRNRLVEDNQLGGSAESSCQKNTLLLTARKVLGSTCS